MMLVAGCRCGYMISERAMAEDAARVMKRLEAEVKANHKCEYKVAG